VHAFLDTKGTNIMKSPKRGCRHEQELCASDLRTCDSPCLSPIGCLPLSGSLLPALSVRPRNQFSFFSLFLFLILIAASTHPSPGPLLHYTALHLTTSLSRSLSLSAEQTLASSLPTPAVRLQLPLRCRFLPLIPSSSLPSTPLLLQSRQRFVLGESPLLTTDHINCTRHSSVLVFLPLPLFSFHQYIT